VALLEHESLGEIAAFFATMDLRIVIHADAPVYTAEELHRLPSKVRRELRKEHQPTHWAALAKPDGRIVARWYGSGTGDEDAIRSAGAPLAHRADRVGG
jgi:hypothetical protein